MKYLEKQGDFMYFYKNTLNLVRNPPSNTVYLHNPNEEIDKFCDKEGWFEPKLLQEEVEENEILHIRDIEEKIVQY